MTAINIENQKEYIETVKKLNEDKNVKYSILTMGCQLNENDSDVCRICYCKLILIIVTYM